MPEPETRACPECGRPIQRHRRLGSNHFECKVCCLAWPDLPLPGGPR